MMMVFARVVVLSSVDMSVRTGLDCECNYSVRVRDHAATSVRASLNPVGGSDPLIVVFGEVRGAHEYNRERVVGKRVLYCYWYQVCAWVGKRKVTVVFP